jgi:hypothetical protein
MINYTISGHHPHIMMQNEAIEIREGNKNFRFSIQEISKMCLRPCKSSYLASLLGNMLSFNDRMYTLCITTKDEREIKIRIKGHHKQQYINLIAQVRRNLKKAMTPRPAFPQAITTQN